MSLLDPAVLAKLEGLELRARKIVEGYVSGMHRSPFQGFSIEFAEHREYTPGDDLRYLDWKVFGKTDKYYLKQYEQETNLICYLVLDASESMQYRGPDSPLSKFEYASCVAAALAHLVIGQQDSVGLVTFDNAVRQFVSPSSNPSHLKQLLHVMQETDPCHKTDTGRIFHDLAERFRHRGLVVVLSDLFDDVRSVLEGVQHLRHRRHDVIVLHMLDAAELDFPFNHVTLFKGLESLPDILTEPGSLRRAYLAEIDAYLKQVSAGCRSLQADYVRVRTDQPIDVVLSRYLADRRRRKAT